jgi:oligo-1,6-glucosidase
MKEFGSMQDFDALLKGMHERGIKLVMDLVVNHSSDEHKWFQESRKSRDNPQRLLSLVGRKGNRLFAGSLKLTEVAGYDKTTDAYYLHYFNNKQPDLNWEKPKLRQEIYSMMNWWFERGLMVLGWMLSVYRKRH